MAGLSPVLRALPEPAPPPGRAGRAVPAAAAGQRPRHRSRPGRRAPAGQPPAPEGHVHARQAARSSGAALCGHRSRAGRALRSEAGRLRAGPDRRPAAQPAEGDRGAALAQAHEADHGVVDLHRALALHRPGPCGEGGVRDERGRGGEAAPPGARPRRERRAVLPPRPSRQGRRRSSPSTPTTSSSTASTATCARRASSASCRW